MKTIVVILLAPLLCTLSLSGQIQAPLRLESSIPLPGVTGKFDHFAIDETGRRLFASATGAGAVEVVDLTSGKTMQTLSGLGKPHGVVWVARYARLFVADGSKGELDVFEGPSLKLVKRIRLSEDADDLAYDPETGLLYVGHGGTDAANPAAVAVIDTTSLIQVADLPVSAHPEGLQLDAVHERIFVNISDTGQIVVIDGKTRSIAHEWTLQAQKGNTPLAYDGTEDRLLVGCRRPAELVVLDGETGREVSAAPADAGADDLFYDQDTRRVYLIAGAGKVDSYQLSQDGKLQSLPVTETAAGAKTGLLIPSLKSLYVGIPGVRGPAELSRYATESK